MPHERLKKLQDKKAKLTAEYKSARSSSGGASATLDKSFKEKRAALDNAIIKTKRSYKEKGMNGSAEESSFNNKQYSNVKKKQGY